MTRLIDTSSITSGWLKRCNLAAPVAMGGRNLPREVAIYLLVTYAKHPGRMPDEVAAFVASRVLASTGIDA